MMDCVLYLFRGADLRLYDNRALSAAFRRGKPVLLVACVDYEKNFTRKWLHLPAAGSLRRRFHFECVADVSRSLAKLSSSSVVENINNMKSNNNNISVATNKLVNSAKDNVYTSSRCSPRIKTVDSSSPLSMFFGSPVDLCSTLFAGGSGEKSNNLNYSLRGEVVPFGNGQNNSVITEIGSQNSANSGSKPLKISELFISKEHGSYELEEELSLSTLCAKHNVPCTCIDDATMLDPDRFVENFIRKETNTHQGGKKNNNSFKTKEEFFRHFPDGFTAFRGMVERELVGGSGGERPAAKLFCEKYCGPVDDSVFDCVSPGSKDGSLTTSLVLKGSTSKDSKSYSVIARLFVERGRDNNNKNRGDEAAISNTSETCITSIIVPAADKLSSNLNTINTTRSNTNVSSNRSVSTAKQIASEVSSSYKHLFGPFGTPRIQNAFATLINEGDAIIGEVIGGDSSTNYNRESNLSVATSESSPTTKKPRQDTSSKTTEGYDDKKHAHYFAGGESAAIERLNRFVWGDHEKDRDAREHGNTPLSTYKDTRNRSLGDTYSSKLSMYLALGCVSARTVCHEVSKFENAFFKNESTYWLVFELLWRDFMKFAFRKHGDAYFTLSGIQRVDNSKYWAGNRSIDRGESIGNSTIFVHRGESNLESSNINSSISSSSSATTGEKKVLTFERKYAAFVRGETGFPYVDAHMRELTATGFMSNRGRQNVASFLVFNLNLDWRVGCEIFEHFLLDHDCLSNAGNWQTIVGIGFQQRENRFNVIKQSAQYEKSGCFIRHWIPELRSAPNEYIHTPWDCAAGIRIPEIYRNPIRPGNTFHYEKARHSNDSSSPSSPRTVWGEGWVEGGKFSKVPYNNASPTNNSSSSKKNKRWAKNH